VFDAIKDIKLVQTLLTHIGIQEIKMSVMNLQHKKHFPNTLDN